MTAIAKSSSFETLGIRYETRRSVNQISGFGSEGIDDQFHWGWMAHTGIFKPIQVARVAHCFQWNMSSMLMAQAPEVPLGIHSCDRWWDTTDRGPDAGVFHRRSSRVQSPSCEFIGEGPHGPNARRQKGAKLCGRFAKCGKHAPARFPRHFRNRLLPHDDTKGLGPRMEPMGLTA